MLSERKLQEIGKMDEIQLEPGVKVIKSKLSRWRVIFPIKNPDGSINYFNLLTGGSWGKILEVVIVVAIMLILILLYRHDTQFLVDKINSISENPCAWCNFMMEQEAGTWQEVNFTAWEETLLSENLTTP